MHVDQVMMPGPQCCRDDATLNDAARIMWDGDFGCVPVVSQTGSLVGMLTDRDICMAAYIRGGALREIRVSEAMSHVTIACRPTDTLESAERLMRHHQIRRLPVLDGDGRPVGVLSINDVVRMSESFAGYQPQALTDRDIRRTLAAIGASRREAVAAE